MALIDIEYGSLASSETMNKNFMYLDDKIAETSDSIMTSISSILSNIATINARLNDMSENVDDSVDTLNSTIEDYKTKVKLLVNKASMIPDWTNASSISGTSFKATKNGYVLILSVNNSAGNLVINQKTFVFKSRVNNYDNVSQLAAYPISDGDSVSCSASLTSAYFVPAKEVSLDDF